MDNGTCRAIRREVLLLGELLARMPALLGATHAAIAACYVGHDFNVRACGLLRRPDLLFRFARFALLVECDEHGHRGRTEWSELSHLEVIRSHVASENGLCHLAVCRVNPDGPAPMFRRAARAFATAHVGGRRYRECLWEPTEHFAPKLRQVCETLRPWFLAGLARRLPQALVDIPAGHPRVTTKRLFFSK